MAELKYSRQRNIIRENLASRRDHPTADMVYSDLRKISPRISLGTVYRNLNLLAELGEIRKIPSTNGADRFDGNTAPHNHFLYRTCGTILDLAPVQNEQLLSFARNGFEGVIDDCSISFFGICPSCSASDPSDHSRLAHEA